MRLRHRRAHLALWGLMALLLPAVLVGALALRFGAPAPDAPVRIAPP
jgi:hypothetical protein